MSNCGRVGREKGNDWTVIIIITTTTTIISWLMMYASTFPVLDRERQKDPCGSLLSPAWVNYQAPCRNERLLSHKIMWMASDKEHPWLISGVYMHLQVYTFMNTCTYTYTQKITSHKKWMEFLFVCFCFWRQRLSM